MYYIYLIRCQDNSIYTGITNNLERRLQEHLSKDEKCAKYTKSHPALKLETAWQTENKKLAAKLEYAIKTLKKQQKEDLITGKIELKDVFKERLECDKYKKVTFGDVS